MSSMDSILPDLDAISGAKTLKVEFDNDIAWVTLNRPEERNAIGALAGVIATVGSLMRSHPENQRNRHQSLDCVSARASDFGP